MHQMFIKPGIFIVILFLTFGSTQVIANQTIEVFNNMSEPVWIIITEEKSHITKKETHKIGDEEFEVYYKYVIKGNVKSPIEGVPVEASVEQQQEFKKKLRKYWETNQKEEYEWSGFIKEGELEIAPGKMNKWTRTADKANYYISIRSAFGGVTADNVGRSEKRIKIDASGHIDDDRVAIQNGASVCLFDHNRTVGRVEKKTATLGKSCMRHNVKTLNKSKRIESGSIVRLITTDPSEQKAKYIYCAAAGWAKYDTLRQPKDKTNFNKQTWMILKTNNPKNSKGKAISYGDEVQIYNQHYKSALLTGKNKSKWVQCKNDSKTIWRLAP